jgi:hypothetical protein
VIEAHPVGVIEDPRAVERAGQILGAAEVQRADFDAIAERVLAIRRVGERADARAACQQKLGDVTAGVTEGAGDDMKIRWHHSAPPPWIGY